MATNIKPTMISTAKMVMTRMSQMLVLFTTPKGALRYGVKSGGVHAFSQSVHEQDPKPEMQRIIHLLLLRF